jgi:hypothetical protein
MLRILDPHVGHIATTFTTIDFIGRFSMTAVEGHRRLNELAKDGLVASVPGRAVETWHLTRDGAYVLSPDRKRVTKKFIADIQACLKAIGPELLEQGAVELSIGGRPMAGKPNGQVLVGLRLKNVPFASPSDDSILRQLCAALDAAVSTDGYAAMLFYDKVPFRLRDRTVIVAHSAAVSGLRTGDELIDEDEREQLAWHARFRALHGLSDGFSLYHYQAGLPWGLLNALEVARFAEDLPLHGAASTWAPDDSAIVMLDEFHADTFDKDYRRWDDWPTNLFATLECRAATNSLHAFFKEIQSEQLTANSFYRMQPLLDLARWDGEFERAAAHALRHYRAQLAESRAATAARVKPKLEPLYLTFFDTLNFGPPRVIGFARQPAGHNAHVDGLVDQWNTVLRTLDGAASACLKDNGFNAGGLSLDVRAATPEEVAVFHEACKRQGTSFRYWLFLPGDRMACQKAARGEYKHLELDTPQIFREATLGRCVHPRLLSPPRFFEQHTLKDIVRAAEPVIRAALEQNIVFVDEVSMTEFARNASLQPCVDSVVLSSNVLDVWKFSASQNGDWTARATGESWSVQITTDSGDVEMTLAYGEHSDSYGLAPMVAESDRGHPYDNTLGALLGLLSTVRGLGQISLPQVWAEKVPQMVNADDKQKFKWLARELYFGLSNDNYYSWPYFPESDAEPTCSGLQ